MAVLSTNLTQGRGPSFNKYVRDNPSWEDLVLNVENKITATFFKETKKSTHGVLPEKTEMTLLSNQESLIGKLRVAHVKVGTKRGYIALKEIRKPTTNVMDAEEAAIRDLERLIDEIVSQVGAFKVCTPVGNWENINGLANVSTKAKVNGRPRDYKADFALTSNGVPKIFISHKKVGGPEAYQQYGGVTQVAGTPTNRNLIYMNAEVQSFLSEAGGYIQNERLTRPVYRFVESDELINQSVYGPEYGGAFSNDNVQCIGQGNPIFRPMRNEEACFSLDFSSHVSWNGDLTFFKTSRYRAAFAATYRAGRGWTMPDGTRYNGARAGIYPIALVQNRSRALEI